jgi:hypothetical protein
MEEEKQVEDGAFVMIPDSSAWTRGEYSILEAEALGLLEAMKEAHNMNLISHISVLKLIHKLL